MSWASIPAANANCLLLLTILSSNPRVKQISGNVHGQYYNLLHLFEYGGYPPEANHLLLGDYANCGKQSVEYICLLLAYKIKYPENFFIIHGNHQCASINQIYSFYNECKRRYSVRAIVTSCKPLLPPVTTYNGSTPITGTQSKDGFTRIFGFRAHCELTERTGSPIFHALWSYVLA